MKSPEESLADPSWLKGGLGGVGGRKGEGRGEASAKAWR